jgi:hypothetical protein
MIHCTFSERWSDFLGLPGKAKVREFAKVLNEQYIQSDEPIFFDFIDDFTRGGNLADDVAAAVCYTEKDRYPLLVEFKKIYSADFLTKSNTYGDTYVKEPLLWLYDTLAHESVHLVQIMDGRLYATRNWIYWEGRPFLFMKWRKYENLPWEKEAWAQTFSIVDRFVTTHR